MNGQPFVLVESNTTGSGRLFCAAARRLGLRPVVLARDPARYPYLAEDAVDGRRVDTASIDAVLAAIEALGAPVAGVTSSSEYFIATAGEAARRLGLPHVDPDAVRGCRDKARQRAVLAAAGVPVPRFAPAATVAAAVAAAGRIGGPVVCKPVAGSGSVGVRLCTSPAEVRRAAAAVLEGDPAALGLPPQPAIVVERYVAGTEYSVEIFDDAVVAVTRKYLGAEPHFVEVGHDVPAALGPGDAERIGAVALRAVRALGLRWSPAHVELRDGPAGVSVIEVNPRLAGGMIPRAVQAATGIDLIAATVARAAGRRADPAAAGDATMPGPAGAAAVRFLVADRPGRLHAVDGVEAARRLPGVVDVGVLRQPGSEVALTHSFQDRLAYVIAGGPEPAVAGRRANAALAALQVSIAPAPDAVPAWRR
ncbi:ATP-grasp domain-containing protein [Dactylosporangium sp. NPDC000555]|uniref:ATP-grasp domain-containing protein n=1 Tax=Dactylosporangium sp. NPDC000555 TaxID=3154260 RepID=UPI00332080A4